MGTHRNIGYDYFPKQQHIGEEVEVYFHYDSSKIIPGIIVRSDAEKPRITIIKLADGRFVSDEECFYFVPTEPRKKKVTYQIKVVALDHDTKHTIVGSLAARSYLDMDYYPFNVINEGEIFTDAMLDKLIAQNRDSIEIKIPIESEEKLIEF